MTATEIRLRLFYAITCHQPSEDNVVDMRVRKTVRAAVVLERGDDPAPRFDRQERRDARALE